MVRMGGWEEKWRLKLTSAKVEVELGNNNKPASTLSGFDLIVITLVYHFLSTRITRLLRLTRLSRL